jgi:hypothetical protein
MGSLWVFHGVRARTHLILLSGPDPDGQGASESIGMHPLQLLFPSMTADLVFACVQHHKLTRFRHTVRAMKFAGVHQGDWHLDQVICSTPPDTGDEAPSLVLIDFAFAPQHLGDNGTPCRLDVSYLRVTLQIDWGIDKTLLEECWPDAIWQEY